MLILTKGEWTDHVQKLESTINILKGKGLKYNIEKVILRKNRNGIIRFLGNMRWHQINE